MAEIVKQILAKPIQLADQVTKAADEAHSFKQECAELKSKTIKLADQLRQAARASNDLYERPTRRIIDETEQALEKALALVAKCRANGLMKRVFTIIPAAAFKKMLSQLENSIGDISWLLRVSASASDRGDNEYLGGLPPIAANEPILCLIWEQIATLSTGSADDRTDAAGQLASLARGNERYGKLIIEEGGVGPLLKLVKDGKLEGQENAANTIGYLAWDVESVDHMIHAGVCSVFAKVLKEGPMKVQASVACAVAVLAKNHPKCQDHFAQNNIIRLLVGHLAFETVQEHSKYAITSHKNMSIHSVVLASNNSPNSKSNNANNNTKKVVVDEDERQGYSHIPHPMGSNEKSYQMHNVVKNTIAHTAVATPESGNVKRNVNNTKPVHHQNNMSLSGTSIKGGRELEDPETKARMKAMSAKALWLLAKGNSAICKSITESRALLCFAVLLEKGTADVQYNSAMALQEIAAVAEQDSDLRQSAFKPNSPAAKAVVDQVLKIIEKPDFDLLIPCIKVTGYLARTFRATETRIIRPLVRLLDEGEADQMVTMEAADALKKFACTENYLHLDHCKAIIEAGGVKHLIQLVYFTEHKLQILALALLCYIALHVPDNEALAQAEVLTALEWASKQTSIIQNPSVNTLLPEAKGKLELYQSRGTRR
ncbi:hypothetical protein GIB67_028685 [Kingdonia uniflora]|uniref:DUF7792 domain-containing protein n=1 Tax=Kingdonia uniflora TaxID=39325 RepID=A0A7J7N9S7_9MAGN|nr:hypothetical protein GIB67_028685 [Kingdonia uniflora]